MYRAEQGYESTVEWSIIAASSTSRDIAKQTNRSSDSAHFDLATGSRSFQLISIRYDNLTGCLARAEAWDDKPVIS